MIKAVLFDLGGTLHVSVTSKARTVEYCRRLLERLADYDIFLDTDPETLAVSLHENAEAYKHHTEETRLELPADEIWSDYYLREFHIPRERLTPIAEELSFRYDYDRPKVIRRPHIAETFSRLKAMGIRTGIISNIISTGTVNHFLREYGIAEDMSCEIMSSVVKVRKPDAEIFRIAERQLGLKPEELCYVGDTLSRDVLGCRNAGWHTMIQIPNSVLAFRDAGFEDLCRPDYVISDLLEIPAIIEQENKQN